MTNDSIMRDYAEKRDFIRMQVNARIELQIPKSGETLIGKCKDLSGMGMLLELDRPLEIGTEVHTSLPSNSPDFPTFETTARVVRCDTTEDSHLAGLEITKIER